MLQERWLPWKVGLYGLEVVSPQVRCFWTSELVYDMFQALVDSKFVDTYHLKTSVTPPVALHLFDGLSNSTISEIANLPIISSTGDWMNLDFYVTLLDSFCSLVFGYNWLARYNPLIDWINGSINFHPSLQENLTLSCIAANTPLASPSFLDNPLQSSDSAVSMPASETSVSNSEWPNIAIIGTAAFLRASKLLGSHNFKLCLHSSDIQANSTKLAETPDLSNVPSEYHEFANVFSKTKAETLPPHRPYDLKINLEEGAQPLVGPIYSLSAYEQEALKEFIEENLNTGFIQPTLSLHSAPVSYTSLPVQKQRTCGETTSKPYKPTFHGSHLSCNMSHSSAATLWIFRLPWWRYSYSTQSSMTKLLLLVSQHWNLHSGQ